MSSASNLKNAAFKYAFIGWRIFPIAPMAKTPPLVSFTERATDDLDAIDYWWTKWPTANIGLLCGDGLLVLDVDTIRASRPGINGFDTLKRLQGPYDRLPCIWEQSTPSGGRHMFFNVPKDFKVGDRSRFPGVDIKYTNSYVVLYPSELLGPMSNGIVDILRYKAKSFPA